MKATEQYFDVVLFIILHKFVLTFKLVDENLAYVHANESYLAVLSCGTAVLTFELWMKPVCTHIFGSYSFVALLLFEINLKCEFRQLCQT